MVQFIKKKRVVAIPDAVDLDGYPVSDNERYWKDHNVTNHAQYPDADASLSLFHWRNEQYFGYIDMLPVAGHDGEVILDYGCGPGHDLVGFGHYSRPSQLIGADVSISSLHEANMRLGVHGIDADFVRLKEDQPLPLPDRSIDYIHCSGVLHHVRQPDVVLQEFRRVIKPGGRCRLMVYNYDSLWLHLMVAFVRQCKGGEFKDLDIRAAFAKTTDGPNCPISRVYKPEDFSRLVEPHGFNCRFLGAALSAYEMTFFPQRFEAFLYQHLPAEHRRFLAELTLDNQGLPLYRGHYAGVDGCYEITPI
jgi:SAM-dependent methyltransferase